MKVKDAMTCTAVSCAPATNLAATVELFWKRNCGMLPVVNENGKVIGVLTDRDVSVALGTRNRLASEITAGEVATMEPMICGAEDDVHEAMQTMAKAKVRRLVVVNKEGLLQGILSMDDLVAQAQMGNAGKPIELSSDDVIRALKGIYGSKFPVVPLKKAAA